MDGGPDLLARIERVERDTRLLKRACAILLALLAAGVLVMQLVLDAHMHDADNAHPQPVDAAPARR
jgi:hypothetical protein